MPAARLRLVAPDEVRRWSGGEVTRAETLRPSGKPVSGGLFCPNIFGDLMEWRCRCNNLTGESLLDTRCSRCSEPVLLRPGRRQRPGHIELAAPVAHIWFVKVRPSPLAQLLDLRPSDLERIVYGEAFLVLKSESPGIAVHSVLERAEYERHCLGPNPILSANTGGSALAQALAALDLAALVERLKSELGTLETRLRPSQTQLQQLRLRLRTAEQFQNGPSRPEWMVLRCLPVVSPALRPTLRLSTTRIAFDELTPLYRNVIACNERVRELNRLQAPRVVLRHEQILLQHAVDAVLDNDRSRRPVTSGGFSSSRPLRSLTDRLCGKQGRFRGSLLGKRVDYSARSVIVVGPELKLFQVGLPRPIVLGLFEPILLGEFLRLRIVETLTRGQRLLEELAQPELISRSARLAVAELVRQTQSESPELRTAPDWLAFLREAVALHPANSDDRQRRKRGAGVLAALPGADAAQAVQERLLAEGPSAAWQLAVALLERQQEMLWDVVRQVIAGHPVLLNRAPTLHRPSIQAFEPVLTHGNAIRLHPLVCRGFNADFDGDQMAVHLPLSEEAIGEALTLMVPGKNLFNPANGHVIVAPSQDIVLGCYYLTVGGLASGHPLPAFADAEEVQRASELGKLPLHTRILFRLPAERDVLEETGFLPGTSTQWRRVETTIGRVLFNSLLPSAMPFYNLALTARELASVFAECRRRCGREHAAALLDRVKQAGFNAVTRSGLSFALSDVPVPREKVSVLERATHAAARLRAARENGDLLDEEYPDQLREVWEKADKELRGSLQNELRGDGSHLNPLAAMADSGARGSLGQIKQLAAMRGLMASVSGRLIERPITASLREGLPTWDYFVSAYGGRKGLTDKGVRTAEAGYLTRKLVACAQRVIVREADCGTTLGLRKKAPAGALAGRVTGRVSLQTVEVKGEVIVRAGDVIAAEQARRLAELEVDAIVVRSPITCRARLGICQRCYGTDLTSGELAALGTAAGVLAAQSIGEPGTQLTLRVFHVGGVLGKDIVNDLERVSRLLEASEVSRAALLATRAGIVRIRQTETDSCLLLEPDHAWPMVDERVNGHKVRVEDGTRVDIGAPLTDGDTDFRLLLRLVGPEATAAELLEQVRKIYREHQLDIDDRHFEVVLSRMLGFVQVTRGGASLQVGQVLERRAFTECNQRVGPEHRAIARPWLLGISQAALRETGFLAAAGFQRTASVLTEAAIEGRVDALEGLSENLLLGRRIP